MSKTPHEVRFDLLDLAKDILSTSINEKRQVILEEWRYKFNNGSNQPVPELPEFPDQDDIIIAATKLKEFVDNP